MRLAFIAHNLIRGNGQGRINYELVRHAARAGHHVTLLADRVDPDLLAAEPNLRWDPVRQWPRRPNLLGVRAFAAAADRRLRRTRRDYDAVLATGYSLTEPHDLNLCQFVNAAWLASPVHVARLARGPWAWYQWAYTRCNASWERDAYAAAATVVAPSEKIRAELAAIGVPADRLAVVHNGVDLDEFHPRTSADADIDERIALGLPPVATLALFVGDIRTPRKNLDSVLKALRDVPTLHLAVVGALDRSPFPALARDLGVADRVTFAGYRRDVGRFMRAADLFVFPSRYEAGTLVLMEAAASGLPLVTARTAGGCEVFGPDAAAVIDDPDDLPALTAAIRRFADSPDDRRSAAAAARATAARYAWAAMAQRYLGLLGPSPKPAPRPTATVDTGVQPPESADGARRPAVAGAPRVKLLVISHACATPVNQQLYAEVQRLTGWDVSILVPSNWRDEYGRTCSPERWPQFEGRLLGRPVLRPGNIVLHAYRARLATLIRQVRPDVLYVAHEPYALATVQALWAARRSGVRPVVGFYSAQNITKQYPIPFRWTEAAVLRAARFAFPVSREVERTLRVKGYAGATTVLPLGIDPAVYFPHPDASATRRELLAGSGADRDAVLIGYVGRLVPEKGLATLVQAVGTLADLNWRLVLIGSGPMEPELRRMAALAGIADRVVFSGFVPHASVSPLVSALDVMVLPSESQANWREQFGRVILEAMACGTPVLGSDSGEIPVLINDTGGGLVFRERDPADLAAKLRTLITDVALSRRLSQAGATAVAARYTVADVAKAFATTVRAALASASDARPTAATANALPKPQFS